MVGLRAATGGEKEQSNNAHTHCAADSTTTHTNPKLLSTTIRASKRKGAAAQPDRPVASRRRAEQSRAGLWVGAAPASSTPDGFREVRGERRRNGELTGPLRTMSELKDKEQMNFPGYHSKGIPCLLITREGHVGARSLHVARLTRLPVQDPNRDYSHHQQLLLLRL